MFRKAVYLFCAFITLIFFTSCDGTSTAVDVKTPVRLAVEEGSLEEFAGEEYALSKGFEVDKYDTLQSAVIAVQNGKADFVLINSDTATDSFVQTAELKLFENTVKSSEYCAVTSKENSELAEEINSAIKNLKENGAFEKIERKYKEEKDDTPIYGEAPNGEITVLCMPVFPNRITYDEDGNITGIEVDFINAICNEIGVTPNIVAHQKIDEMFYSLENGEGDIIISAVTYTEQRAEQYNLSIPYSSTTFGVYEWAER